RCLPTRESWRTDPLMYSTAERTTLYAPRAQDCNVARILWRRENPPLPASPLRPRFRPGDFFSAVALRLARVARLNTRSDYGELLGHILRQPNAATLHRPRTSRGAIVAERRLPVTPAEEREAAKAGEQSEKRRGQRRRCGVVAGRHDGRRTTDEIDNIVVVEVAWPAATERGAVLPGDEIEVLARHSVGHHRVLRQAAVGEPAERGVRAQVERRREVVQHECERRGARGEGEPRGAVPPKVAVLAGV